jgi:hypothetical protein
MNTLSIMQKLDNSLEKVERTMEALYETARQVAAIQGGKVKDMYWRLWKQRVFSALDAHVSEINAMVARAGLQAKVCHSSSQTGATIFIEYYQAGRKWLPPRAAPSAVQVPAVPPPTGAILWDPTQIDPANAYKLLQIVLAGVSTTGEAALPKRKPLTNTSLVPSAVYVPLCSLPICSMKYSTWTNLADISAVDVNITLMAKYLHVATYR